MEIRHFAKVRDVCIFACLNLFTLTCRWILFACKVAKVKKFIFIYSWIKNATSVSRLLDVWCFEIWPYLLQLYMMGAVNS